MSDATSIAVEHVTWCKGQGFFPGEVMASLGFPDGGKTASWDDATWAVEQAWRSLHMREAA